MEESLCQQRLHKAHQRRDQGRIRPPAKLPFQCTSVRLRARPDSDIQLVTHNHDAQVRFRWNKNDLAIWDNRSNWHCATYDYEAARAGDRVASLGEAPYLDLSSTGRREALLRRQNSSAEQGTAESRKRKLDDDTDA